MSTDRRKMPPTGPKTAEREETSNVVQAVADLVYDELSEALAKGRNKTIAEVWDIEVLRVNILTMRVQATPPDGVPRHFSIRISEV